MRFKGIDNQTVELKIHNYQFPKEEEFDEHENWLQIYLKVNSKVGNWQTIDPSLTVSEIKELINWFAKLSKNEQPEYNEMRFIEPNLSFWLLNDYNANPKMIQIAFNAESRPISASNSKEYFVDIRAGNHELEKISVNLNEELKRLLERKASP